MCMDNRTEWCREWKGSGLKSTEPEASLQKVLPIIRGMKRVLFLTEICQKHTWQCNMYCYSIFLSFLMKIMENRLYQNFCFFRAYMCTSNTNSEYICEKRHVLCIKVINNKKPNFKLPCYGKDCIILFSL